jgi:hypothetical protein
VKRAKREGLVVDGNAYGDRSIILKAAVRAYIAPVKRGPRS